ncbi:MAG: PIN domain-containing protein [archaeon]
MYLPYTVLEELDSLKDKKPHLRNRIFDIVNELNILKDNVNILYDEGYEVYDNKDNKIINEIKSNISELEQPVFITNDKLFQFKAYKNNIPIEEYKNSNPLKQESEEYTGFINIMEEDKINNCFFWNEKGQIEFYSSEGSHTVYYENIP